jgi:DNA polymerase-3 subunit gamma/tau
MTNALYNKWRPQKWDEVVGQPHVIQTLRNAVVNGHVVHAYLFAGPRGTGKTTVARLLAKAVNCADPDPANRPCNQCDHCKAVNEGRYLDLIEIDAASQTGVEDVRALRDKINFIPNLGMYKIYIIDEVHMFSNSAFNALLKTLEEPPTHAIFILATTEMHKIPATVLSRCQRHEFRRLPVDEIISQLNHIIESEKLTAEPEALTLIARQSAGGMRDAISLLDQMASTGMEITLGLTQTILGTATNQTVLAIVDAVLNKQPSAGMDAIHAALNSGSDPRQLARQVVDYLRAVMLIQMGNNSQAELTSDVRYQAKEHAAGFSQADVLQMIKLFNEAASDQRGGWQPSLPLELALAEGLETPAVAPSTPGTPSSKGALNTKIVSSPQAKNPPDILFQSADPREEITRTPEIRALEAVQTEKPVVTLKQVAGIWKQVCATIKPQSSSLNALLNSARLLEVKDGLLVLGFQSELLRSKADTPEQMKIIRAALVEALGVDVPVRCVVSMAKQSAPPNVKEDGMVAAALKKGGKIIDTQE